MVAIVAGVASLIQVPKTTLMLFPLTRYFLQIHALNIAGEKLTRRVRNNMFKAILRQELGWFDKKENSVGAICARLSTDATHIQGVSIYFTSKIKNKTLHTLTLLGIWIADWYNVKFFIYIRICRRIFAFVWMENSVSHVMFYTVYSYCHLFRSKNCWDEFGKKE